MANTIKALYRNDTWSLATYYQAFDANNLMWIWRSEYTSTWINIMWSIDWQHQIIKKWERFIADWDYIAAWQASSWSSWLLFILTNSSATQVINYVFKTRTELWSNYNIYRNAFRWSMTDEIRSEVKNLFSISLTVTTSWNEILISDGRQSIIVNSTTHAIRYNADYYDWTNDTSLEYSTLSTNWWLVDWTYTYPTEDQKITDWDNIIASLKTKWIANATITHDTVNWEITMTNGQWSFTIADKNVWASVVYEYWDTLSETNCGKYFEWGNNYWFPFTWATTTSSTLVADVSWYWPWNYYSSDTFITDASGSRYSWTNDNLWWDTTDTEAARQWPCQSWYHIPTRIELNNFFEMFKAIRPNATHIDLATEFYLPFAWHIYAKDANISTQWQFGHYWASSASSSSYSSPCLLFYAIWRMGMDWTYKWNWLSIRPFKNTTTS